MVGEAGSFEGSEYTLCFECAGYLREAGSYDIYARPAQSQNQEPLQCTELREYEFHYEDRSWKKRS